MKKVTGGAFDFSRKDRIGILIFSGLIIAVFLLPKLLPSPSGSENPDTTWIASVRKLEQRQKYLENPVNSDAEENVYTYQFDRSVNRTPPAKGKTFYFDPNILPAEGWKELGIQPRTIQTIQNYLSKGGRFRKPEDIEHIYGLHQDDYQRLLPYVKIQPTETVQSFHKETYLHKQEFVTYTSVDINLADTAAWIALPGIGSKLAMRIVNFREKLGGFYSINQIAETYGLPDSVFQKIKTYLKFENTTVRKININTALLEELKSHPYIRYAIANAIVTYRNEHGPFQKIEDIKNIMIVTDEVFNKCSAYLTIE